MKLVLDLIQTTAVPVQMTDRRSFRNETTGYVRRGMPLRAPGESEAIIQAAVDKRARRAERNRKIKEKLDAKRS